MSILLYFSLLLLNPSPQTVNITITSSVAEQGKLHLAVYNCSEGFKSRKEVFSVVRATSGTPLFVEIKLPVAGDYVLAAFHDLNGNGELDLNVFGVPTEPYGFGQAPPSKWREPEFNEIATTVSRSGTNTTINLKKWKEY